MARYPDIEEVMELLPPAGNKREKLVTNQNVYDIVRHSLAVHKEYAGMYDNIAPLFWMGNVPDTCLSIFSFCKKYIPYDAEKPASQTVKSPSQILSDGQIRGIDQDCKHYGLFCCGIVDSLHRQGYPISCKFRFASDVAGERYPKHVFCLVYDPEASEELWLDPVLNYFNEFHKYYYFLDKQCKTMPLYKISGVSDNDSSGGYGFGAEMSNAYVGKHKGLHIKIKAPKIKVPHIKIQPGKLLLKVGLAPSRNSFLLLVKVNAFDIAYNFFKHAQTPTGRDKIKKLWEKVGGKWKVLSKAINQGFRVYDKHHGKKMPQGWHTISGSAYNMEAGGYMGVVGADDAAEGGALAVALPVIKVFLDLFKQLGISTQKIQTKAGDSVKTLSINHNNSDHGMHDDGTETSLEVGKDGKQHLSVHSFQGNQEEGDDGEGDAGVPGLPELPMSQAQVPYADAGSDPDTPSPTVQKDVANKVAEKDADEELPDATTPAGTAVNVFTDWAKGFKNFIVQNKGTVITIAAVGGSAYIVHSIFNSQPRKRRR